MRKVGDHLFKDMLSKEEHKAIKEAVKRLILKRMAKK